MLTTFTYFFAHRRKEWLILTVVFDVLCLSLAAFFIGRTASWTMTIICGIFVYASDECAQYYFRWREKKRILWRDEGQKTIFPLPWMSYADLWGDLLRRPMAKGYLALLVLGKLSTFLSAV